MRTNRSEPIAVPGTCYGPDTKGLRQGSADKGPAAPGLASPANPGVSSDGGRTRTARTRALGTLPISCHAGDGGKERALPGPDFWSPEACRREDGGGGGRVVRADFPLRAEQTAVNYWKAEPAPDSSLGGPPSQNRASRAALHRTSLLPTPQRGCGSNSLHPPPEWPGLHAGGSTFLWTLTSRCPRPGVPGSAGQCFTEGAWGERSPICSWPKELRRRVHTRSPQLQAGRAWCSLCQQSGPT